MFRRSLAEKPPIPYSFLEFGKVEQETILFLHGYADSAAMFDTLGRSLQGRFHVLAPDFPMVHQRKQPQRIDNLVAYVHGFVTAKHLRRFTLVGFSLGGLVAIAYAKTHPENVKRLYLLNSLPQLYSSAAQLSLYRLLKPFLASKTFCRTYSIFVCNRSLRRLRKIPPIKDSVIWRMRTNAISVFGTLFRAIDVSLTEAFNALSIPKCIVLFEDDEILHLKRYRRLLPLLASDLVVFDQGGHASKDIYWKKVRRLWSSFKKP